MVRMKHFHLLSIVASTLFSQGDADSNSLEMHEHEANSDHQRRANLHQREQSHNNFLTDEDQDVVSPPLSDCLYSASSSEECAEKEGCVLMVQRTCVWAVLDGRACTEDEFSPFFDLLERNACSC